MDVDKKKNPERTDIYVANGDLFRLRDGGDCLVVETPDGFINLRPEASNKIFIQKKDFGKD